MGPTRHEHPRDLSEAGRPTRRHVLGLAAGGLALAACTASGERAESRVDNPPGPAVPSAAASSAGASADSSPPSPTPAPSTASAAPTAQELPRGGRTVFPTYRLAGFCGYPGSPALGKLGIGDLEARAAEIEALAPDYGRDRTMLPVLELIATLVHGKPGPDGLYRSRTDSATIQRHLDVARRHRAYLLLNIQPGRAEFLDEVRAYESWLTQPDVGVALDPEWAVGRGQVPGKVFGRVEAATLNDIGSYVSGLVTAHNLPEKVVLYHQLSPSIVRNESALRAFPGVAWVKSIDGIGARADKVATWTRIVASTPAPLVHLGFKLFFEEDAAAGPLMTPAQVMALTPTPEYVMYE